MSGGAASFCGGSCVKTLLWFAEIQSKRQERKRRTTANPVYSGAVFEPEVRNEFYNQVVPKVPFRRSRNGLVSIYLRRFLFRPAGTLQGNVVNKAM